jgi:acyl dehydratase
VEANKIGYDDVLAQGLLIFSLTGRLSSEYLSVINRGGVTYGYEKSRFIKPVYPNAILKFTYHPKIMRKNNILESEITVLNSSNETAFVTTHLLKII